MRTALARKPPYLFRVFALLVVGTAVLRFAHLSALAGTAAPARVPAHQLFETLARAVVAAGAELVLLQGATGGVSLATGTYPDGTPERHTVADRSSAAVLRRVALAFPGLAVVDEEEVASAGAAGGWRATQAWRAEGLASPARLAGAAQQRAPTLPLSELSVFVDPLDATQEYSEGLWDFVTVSACVARCGVPIVGLLYQPFQQRLYWTRPGTAVNVAFTADGAVEAERALPHSWGEEGEAGEAAAAAAAAAVGGLGGACCPRAAAAPPPMDAAASANATAALRVLLSRSHAGKGTGAALRAALPPDATLTPAGGAGYKFIQLLEGAADAYVHPGGIRKWDVCAGEALLRAAGGAVTQWGGEALDYCLPPLPAAAPPARLDGALAQVGADGAARGAAGAQARTRAMEGAVRVAGLVATRTAELGRALGQLLPASS